MVRLSKLAQDLALALVLTALLACPYQEARATDAPARLTISVEPERIVLGELERATLRVRLAGGGSEGLSLFANVGRVVAVRVQGPGEWTATYVLPEFYHPQVGVIGAVVRTQAGPVHAWKVVPLWGNGEAQVVSRPRAKVEVRIGEHSFGPVRADRNGLAMVPVVVPPGIRKARAGRKVIDLHLPRISQLGAVADLERVPVDRSAGVVVRALTVTETGKPDDGARIEASAGRGRVSATERSGPGEHALRYVPPEQVGDGTDGITVGIAGQAASKVVLPVAVVPGVAERIRLSATPTRFEAGSDQPVVVQARMEDRFGNPASTAPALEVNLGQVDTMEPCGPGLFTARWSLPAAYAGRTKAEVVARLVRQGNQNLTAAASVDLVVAAPAALTFEPLPADLVADGQTSAAVSANARDGFGNGVEAQTVAPAASVGQLQAGLPGGAGRYPMVYKPPLSRRPVTAELSASLGELRATASLPLHEKGYWLTLAPQLGYSSNLQSMNSAWFGAELSLGLGVVLRGLSLSAEAGYAWSDQGLGQDRIASSLSVLPVLGSLRYRFWVHDRIHLGVSAGGGGVVLINSLRLEGQPAVESRTVVAGVLGGAELGVHFGPGHAFVQLRFLWAEADGVGELSGNAGGLLTSVGYRFGLY